MHTRFINLLVIAVLVAAGTVPAAAQSGAYTLRMVFRTDAGAPVSQASVMLFDRVAGDFVRAARADKEGRLETDLPGGEYRLTVIPQRPGPGDAPLVPVTLYSVLVSSDRNLEVVVPAGRVLDTAVVSADGHPLAGARVEVYTDALDLADSTIADAGGWFRVVALPNHYLFVVPPGDGGREMPRWMRVSEVGALPGGFDRPIVLDAIDAPEQTAPDVVRLHRSASPGQRFTIAIVAEGYTDISEPFVDENANGRCDVEPYLDLNGDARWVEGEPFVDVNQNNRPDREPFTDTNGDGIYNTGERAKFLRDAADATRSLLGLPVYRGVRDAIDVYAIFVASRQAGSDIQGAPAPLERDTAFGSRFFYPVYSADLDVAAVTSYASDRVDADAVVALTNDPFRLGRAFAASVVNVFAGPVSEVTTALGHELGHTVASLSDEYFDYDNSPPYQGPEPNTRNITKSAAAGTIKWSRFIRSAAAVPTPDGVVGVGAFEGGRYRRRGLYRPAYNCLMRGPAPVFCAVCADAMQGRLAELSSTARPARPEISSPTARSAVSGQAVVSLSMLDPAPVESATLLVDGVATGPASTLPPFDVVLEADALAPGRHHLVVELLLTNGTVSRTPPVEITAQPRVPLMPSFASATWKTGRLTLVGAANVDPATTVLSINGTDRFPLERLPSGEVRTVKSGQGSASAQRLAKVLKKNTEATLRLRTPQGGVSAPVLFRR